MIRCKLATCGDVVVWDKLSNNVSVVNIISQLNAEGFPVILNKFACLFMLHRDEEDPETPEASLQIFIDDDELHTLPIPVDFQGKLRTNSMVTIQGTVFPRPGTAGVRLLLGEEEVGRWEFEVMQRNGEPKVEAELG